jgi:hypothetical protein
VKDVVVEGITLHDDELVGRDCGNRMLDGSAKEEDVRGSECEDVKLDDDADDEDDEHDDEDECGDGDEHKAGESEGEETEDEGADDEEWLAGDDNSTSPSVES